MFASSRRRLQFSYTLSDTSGFRGPDDFVHLNLEAHRESVGDDFLGEFLPGDGVLSAWNRF